MYIESGIFQDYGINNFSLRRQVSMRKRKKLKKKIKKHCSNNWDWNKKMFL